MRLLTRQTPIALRPVADLLFEAGVAALAFGAIAGTGQFGRRFALRVAVPTMWVGLALAGAGGILAVLFGRRLT